MRMDGFHFWACTAMIRSPDTPGGHRSGAILSRLVAFYIVNRWTAWSIPIGDSFHRMT